MGVFSCCSWPLLGELHHIATFLILELLVRVGGRPVHLGCWTDYPAGIPYPRTGCLKAGFSTRHKRGRRGSCPPIVAVMCQHALYPENTNCCTKRIVQKPQLALINTQHAHRRGPMCISCILLVKVAHCRYDRDRVHSIPWERRGI